MNQQTTPNITLFDLLARSWQRPAGVRQIRFNDDETELAVVTEDGAVAFARMADNEPPESRIVADNGQTGIRPRAGRPSPLIMTRIKGASAACPAEAGGFLIANEKGQLIRASRAGEIADTVFSSDAAVTAFDRCGASGALAIVVGDRLFCRTGTAGASTDGIFLGDFLPTHVGFSRDGSRLALAGSGHIEIRQHDGEAVMLRISPHADPISLAWSADGRWLAIGMQKSGMVLIDTASGRHTLLEGFPGPVRAVGFSGSSALVAAGAYRIAGWSLETPPMENAATGALTTGRSGLALVEAVAIQSRGDLVAAGYTNGQIVVARLGSPDEMILRASGAPVTSLAWTSDGRHLAVGDTLGTAAIVTFPRQLFK